jgi:hypothetical protein
MVWKAKNLMKEQSILTSSDLNLEKALTPAVVDAVTELQ